LSTLEGLHVALLVYAQNQGVFRRIEVQPDHIAQLLDEKWISGKLEASGAMRLHAKERQVTLHGALGDAGLTGQLAHTPVCRALRAALQRRVQQRRNVSLTMRARSAGLG
jgi:hypothetical protein